eukprot:5583522-Pleurochrysis_carterae.AAC.2
MPSRIRKFLPRCRCRYLGRKQAVPMVAVMEETLPRSRLPRPQQEPSVPAERVARNEFTPMRYDFAI